MHKFYYSLMLITFLILSVQTVNASHQVEYRAPASITTTVGELTTIQVDIKNTGSSAEYYRITVAAALPNEIEITNPDILNSTISPGESTSLFTNIRTLTENPNVLTIQIYRDGDLSHAVSTTIAVNSKKFSLPEFGLIGFLQIAAIASVAYFFFGRFKTSKP